jgi:hypothetical protein
VLAEPEQKREDEQDPKPGQRESESHAYEGARLAGIAVPGGPPADPAEDDSEERGQRAQRQEALREDERADPGGHSEDGQPDECLRSALVILEISNQLPHELTVGRPAVLFLPRPG